MTDAETIAALTAEVERLRSSMGSLLQGDDPGELPGYVTREAHEAALAEAAKVNEQWTDKHHRAAMVCSQQHATIVRRSVELDTLTAEIKSLRDRLERANALIRLLHACGPSCIGRPCAIADHLADAPATAPRMFTPSERLLPCRECGKTSGENGDHDWHHPFNPAPSATPGPVGPAPDEPPRCIRCKKTEGACDCTGGPAVETECSCYEVTGGHQPGCAFNRIPVRSETWRHGGCDLKPYDRTVHRCTGCEWFIDTTAMSERQVTDAVHEHLHRYHNVAPPSDPPGEVLPGERGPWPPRDLSALRRGQLAYHSLKLLCPQWSDGVHLFADGYNEKHCACGYQVERLATPETPLPEESTK
jgi:hypothetical protein